MKVAGGPLVSFYRRDAEGAEKPLEKVSGMNLRMSAELHPKAAEQINLK
jgi:hypothetical protein